jgi:hypothetical protein
MKEIQAVHVDQIDSMQQQRTIDLGLKSLSVPLPVSLFERVPRGERDREEPSLDRGVFAGCHEGCVTGGRQRSVQVA